MLRGEPVQPAPECAAGQPVGRAAGWPEKSANPAEMFHIYASNRPGDIKPGSLGKVVEGYELRVLPEDAEGAGARRARPARSASSG